MKYLDEYRDPALARQAAERAAPDRDRALADHGGLRRADPHPRPPGHRRTAAHRHPDGARPGCPVCVIPRETLDRARAVAARPGVILTTFGDMLHVPGSSTDLLSLRAKGADVRVVYTPMDAVRLAAELPDREVVFLAVGFETTAPANAMAVLHASRLSLANFSMLVSHVLVPPAHDGSAGVAGLRGSGLPRRRTRVRGHGLDGVRTEPIADRYRVPIVVTLAVHGTVNDLAMRGAWPIALSVALIVEDGLELSELRSVLTSLGKAARKAGVPVITGDTKVLGRGAADKIFINTTGVGRVLSALRPSAALARPGDAILLSGPIGLHGTTVLSTREGLGFEADIASDSQPLHRLVRAIARPCADVHTLRDPTGEDWPRRSNEIARDARIAVEIEESALPVPAPVAAACDLLGLDPLVVANEGCLVAFVAPAAADDALGLMRTLPESSGAVRIGQVPREGQPGRVVIRTLVGARRVVDIPLGELLPRIC